MEINHAPWEEEALTSEIIKCIIAVHQSMGPDFLEGIYRNALVIELVEAGLKIETEKEVTVHHRDRLVGTHRLDLVVENQVVLELKTTSELGPAHYAQLRSYLKASGLEVGLLVNFSKERADFRRVAL